MPLLLSAKVKRSKYSSPVTFCLAPSHSLEVLFQFPSFPPSFISLPSFLSPIVLLSFPYSFTSLFSLEMKLCIVELTIHWLMYDQKWLDCLEPGYHQVFLHLCYPLLRTRIPSAPSILGTLVLFFKVTSCIYVRFQIRLLNCPPSSLVYVVWT